GGGGLTKTGAGRFELTGDNLYTGDTNITGGILAVNGSITSDVYVQDGGTLAGKGRMGDVTVLSGGILSPGNSVDTLHVASVPRNAGALYEGETNAVTSARTEATGNVSIDGDLTVNPAAGYPVGHDYTIFTAVGTVSGVFDEVEL